jgi:hypothetical protein
MICYVQAPRRSGGEEARRDIVIPGDVRRRLSAWIDIDEVGVEGFWTWLRGVLPLLPISGRGAKADWPAIPDRGEEFRELRRRVAEYARDWARLMVICEERSRECEVLSRRVMALESDMRAFIRAGHPIDIPKDPESSHLSDQALRPEGRPLVSRRPEAHSEGPTVSR